MQTQTRTPGRRRAAALAGLALVALAGCGGGDRPYPVHGKLVYKDNDQPVKELAGFDVTFTAEKGKTARGTIGADGTFRLTTTRADDGAYPGQYKVTVTQPHPNPERRVKGKPVVDLVYEDPQKTDLKATVEAKDNTFTFPLRRLKGSSR